MRNKNDLTIEEANMPLFVTLQIERCPNTLLLREPFQNALEAWKKTLETKTVEFSIAEENDYVFGEADVKAYGKKLKIWNTGKGMSKEDLFTSCNLAASIGKVMGIDGNFGVGGKVAMAPSNRIGIVYTSCRLGVVSRAIIHFDKTRNVFTRKSFDGSLDGEAVVDVTYLYPGKTNTDWTQVVLLGNSIEQDTCTTPRADKNGKILSKPESNWIGLELDRRYFTVATEVEVLIAPGLQTRVTNKTATMTFFKERIEKTAISKPTECQFQKVTIENGVVIWYIFDKEGEDKKNYTATHGGSNLGSSIGFASLIFKNEYYDRVDGNEWYLEAPRYGIPFGGRNFKICVELPDAHPVQLDQYRTKLEQIEQGRTDLKLKTFGNDVASNMPKWFKDKIKEVSPKHADNKDASEYLQKVAKDLQILSQNVKTARDDIQKATMQKGTSPIAGISGKGKKEKRKPPGNETVKPPGNETDGSRPRQPKVVQPGENDGKDDGKDTNSPEGTQGVVIDPNNANRQGEIKLDPNGEIGVTSDKPPRLPPEFDWKPGHDLAIEGFGAKHTFTDQRDFIFVNIDYQGYKDALTLLKGAFAKEFNGQSTQLNITAEKALKIWLQKHLGTHVLLSVRHATNGFGIESLEGCMTDKKVLSVEVDKALINLDDLITEFKQVKKEMMKAEAS